MQISTVKEEWYREIIASSCEQHEEAFFIPGAAPPVPARLAAVLQMEIPKEARRILSWRKTLP